MVPPRRDPAAILRAEGFEFINGYRTDDDVDRIRGQGYKPAANGAHNRADGLDVTHPRLSPVQQERRLNELFRDWGGARVINEGHHRHLQLPGWGAAPGTPGTPNSGIPDLPKGATLVQRGSLKRGEFTQADVDAISEDDLKQLRIKVIKQNGYSPEEEARHIAAVLANPNPGERLAQRETIFDSDKDPTRLQRADQQPDQSTLNWTEEQKRAIQEYVPQAKSPEDLEAFVEKLSEGKLRMNNAAAILDDYRKTRHVPTVADVKLPKPESTTTTEAAVRGFADPFNFLDELGGVADTLGVGGDEKRETVFDSDRSFGDILDQNIDLNRGILQVDQEQHPYARLGGQLASGVLIPVGAGAKTVGQLAKIGAVEGAVAGAGAGEGGIVDRLPSAAAGAAIGTAGGAALGKGFELGGKGLRWLRGKLKGQPIVEDGAERVLREGPSFADEGPPAGQAMAMRMDDEPEVTGAVRSVDRIDVSELPPLPPGASLIDDPTIGRARRVEEAASPEDLAATAGRADPADVVPIPSNQVESLDEALAANPGSIRDIEAPDEFGALRTRAFPSSGARPTYHKGPIDLVGYLRREGGLLDQGGELGHLGIDNKARPLDFARNEQFLGRLVDNENGLPLDEAALRAWEAGYFPDHATRPTVNDLLEALQGTHAGAHRRFHPDDLEEVDRFFATRADREQIEAAAENGAPLAERVGSPATLDDLEANRPPAIAYADLESLGGKAANIDVSKLETRNDIRRALQHTEKMFGGFDAGRRGRVSQAETEALADELGMRADDLLKRRKGQALNAEQALAARRILAKSGEELVALAQRARGGSEDDLMTFRRGMLRHAAIQEQVTGMTAEAGRALVQFKMMAQAKGHREKIMAAIVEGAGGRDNLEDAAQAIIDLQQVPGALNKFAADAVKPTWKDKAVELWYNSLLSGPRTHAVNILSNAITSALQIPEHATAAAVGLVRRSGPHATDRVLMSELGPRVVGLTQGAAEGLRAFKYTFRTGKVPDHVTKVEATQQEAIGGLKGKLLRTPTRLLSAEDEFFKAVARRSELAALAVRKARGEGLKGEALTKRIEELSANPTGEMIERSLDYARYLTFQRPLGAFGQDVQRWTARSPILKLFLPFVRTPTNLLKFAVERSPGAPLLREVRDDFKAGGAKRDLAIARMSLGTGLGLLVTQWTAGGSITGGGPADRSRERLMRADGWQPYSIKVGDKYVSYQRLDPLASTLGVAADLVDLQSAMTEKQQEHVAKLVVASLIQNLANKTWLSGASDLAEAIGDPQRYGDSYTRRLAGSLTTPAASSQLAQTIDPTLREARTVLDAIRARVPGASKSLLPQRDVWGEPIVREGGLGPDLVSPLPVSTDRDDAVTREAIAAGAVIGKPQRKDMSDAEFNEFVRIAGQTMKQAMQAHIADPAWKSMAVEDRRSVFDQEKKAARKAAREALSGAREESTVPPLPDGATRLP